MRLDDTEPLTNISKESLLNITLVIGISKGDRMDWVVQKATELGVHNIQPLLTNRVDTKLNASREEKKIEHWESVAISACEQCGRSVVPKISHPIKITDWLNETRDTLKLVLTQSGKTLKNLNQYEN